MGRAPVTCSHCNRETTAVQIGTGHFCNDCGARVEGVAEHSTPKTTTAAHRSMDLRPTKSNQPAGAPAHTLHSRVTPAKGGVLDLRQVKPKRVAPTHKIVPQPDPPKHTIDHASQAVHHVASPIKHAAPVELKPVAVKRSTGHFEDRYEQAKAVPKSQRISRFGVAKLEIVEPVVRPVDGPVAASAPVLPAAAATHHETLTKFVEHLEQKSERAARAPQASRYAAITAAVIIMGGYIWLQNYPKFAIQAAGSRAGLAASMPGYVPSSFNLSRTDTAPGLVTLSFSSPNQDHPLTIEQHRTAWDSSSLLDNYVAKTSNDYTAVQGQGLTIYLFKQDQAAWVNHGVWYSIAGATQLSREQILKIAYSL